MLAGISSFPQKTSAFDGVDKGWFGFYLFEEYEGEMQVNQIMHLVCNGRVLGLQKRGDDRLGG